MTSPRAYYFGCWQEPGHHLHHVDGRTVHPRDGVPFDPFHGDGWLDGGFAPRHAGPLLSGRYGISSGDVCCAVQGINAEGRRFIADRSAELGQGVFMRHEIRGHTLIAWWDRTQGDSRGASNSVFLVEGEHTVAEMLKLWPQCFPTQAANLERAGVVLREAAA